MSLQASSSVSNLSGVDTSTNNISNDSLSMQEKPRYRWLHHVTLKGSPLFVAGVAALGCAYVGLNNPETKHVFPPCGFYLTTGYYCPGCGMTRAAYNLIHFNFLKAFEFNALFVVAIPILIYLYTWWVVNAYSGKRLPLFSVSRKFAVIIVLAVIIFVVGRNTPFTAAEFFARGRI